MSTTPSTILHKAIIHPVMLIMLLFIDFQDKDHTAHILRIELLVA